jgi:hypothetical protein
MMATTQPDHDAGEPVKTAAYPNAINVLNSAFRGAIRGVLTAVPDGRHADRAVAALLHGH